ncbi:MAG: hypothetical protein AAGG72_01840 [Pseudomonadota bacterium]
MLEPLTHNDLHMAIDAERYTVILGARYGTVHMGVEPSHDAIRMIAVGIGCLTEQRPADILRAIADTLEHVQ